MNLAPGEKLSRRYQIISQLGQGGFGKTFLAQDQHLPGNQKCVVKQLKPQATDPFTLQTARRLFDTEAQTLYQLGTHPQIPQLFAYFEENQEFYLVQEYIEGDELSQELNPPLQGNQRRDRSDDEVISLLQEILEILEFVHQHNVIHRDVNPRNIIRSKKDGKLVLIDFGAVKQISTQIVQKAQSNYTVAIGTPGYRPSEQANGHPQLSSDIYAVGMIGIQALTGCLPHQLPANLETGEISWHDRVTVSPRLAKVLDTMVRYDFRERYPSATQALQAVKDLTTSNVASNVATLALPGAKGTTSPAAKPKKSRSLLYKGLISLGIIGLSAAAFVSITNLINSTNASDFYKQGKTLYELNRYEKALEAYNKALQIRPNYREAWKGQGDTLKKLKRYEEALEAYEKAIQIQLDYWQAWIGRAQVLESLERYKEAIDAFNAAIKIQPDYWEAWQGKGNVQVKLKQYSEAVATFDKLLKLQPNDTSSWYQRGWALHNLREYEEAVQSYDQAVKLKPDFYQSWYQRGNTLMNLKRYEEAVESYDKAVQFQPSLSQAWYSRGIALNHLGQYKAAIVSYDQAIKAKSNYSEAWYNRGWALHQAKRYAEAVASYDKAIKLKRDYYQAWYNRGNSLYNLGEYQQTIASYERAVAIKKDYYQAWNSRGNALFKLERYQEAIASYEQALNYKPDYREAREGRERAQRLFDLVIPNPG